MKNVFSCLISALALVGIAHAGELKPARHADFPRYTYALTWQPGFCSTGGGCLPGQSHEVKIGLHGLWASEPQSLIDQNVPVRQWWAQGCSSFPHVTMVPALPDALQQQLRQFMPQLQDDLQLHEYVKHAQCFGFPAQQFFATALSMRQAAADSGFGHYLLEQAGQTRSREDLQDAFAKTFGTDQRRSLQLQCGKDAQGRNVLTQFWFTLQADKLAAFPAAESFVNTPDGEYEDSCAQPFLLPDW
ncbi:ribonuclease T2 family protein [Chromobacterium alticapitis]|nr:ribonuclease I [Chromobacterium alticapitis]